MPNPNNSASGATRPEAPTMPVLNGLFAATGGIRVTAHPIDDEPDDSGDRDHVAESLLDDCVAGEAVEGDAVAEPVDVTVTVQPTGQLTIAEAFELGARAAQLTARYLGAADIVDIDGNQTRIRYQLPADHPAVTTVNDIGASVLYHGNIGDHQMTATLGDINPAEAVVATWDALDANADIVDEDRDVTETFTVYYSRDLRDGPWADADIDMVISRTLSELAAAGFAALHETNTIIDGEHCIVTYELVGDDNPDRPLRLLGQVGYGGSDVFPFGTVGADGVYAAGTTNTDHDDDVI